MYIYIHTYTYTGIYNHHDRGIVVLITQASVLRNCSLMLPRSGCCGVWISRLQDLAV